MARVFIASRPLLKLALRSPRHIPRGTSGSRNVAGVLLQGASDVLPFESSGGQRLLSQRQTRFASFAAKGRDDLRDAGRLGQVLRRTELDGFRGGRDARVSCNGYAPHLNVPVTAPPRACFP